MDGFHSLDTLSQEQQQQRETWLLQIAGNILLRNGMDILYAIKYLHDHNYINDDVIYERLLMHFSTTAYNTEGNRLCDFLESLCSECPLRNSTIMNELKRLVIKGNTNLLLTRGNIQGVSLTRLRDLDLLRFFSELKGKMDSSTMGATCQQEAENCIQRAENTTDFGEKQCFYNQFAIAKALEIQQHRDSGMQTCKAIYDDIIGKIPDSVDKTFAKLIVMSKTATTLATVRNFNECNVHICEILRQMQTTQNKLPIFAYDMIYASRCEDTHSHVSRVDDIVAIGTDAIDALATYSNSCEVTKYFERLIRVHVVHTLLGIGVDLSVKPVDVVNTSRKELAKVMLDNLKTNCWPMEERREMMYSFGQARLFEIEGGYLMALHYANRALALTSKGAYYNQDTDNITAYRNHMYAKAIPIFACN